MFNYKSPQRQNYRYNSEENMPNIIEKMYKLGGKFSYNNKSPQMNYSIKINKLKMSSKELNNQIRLYREDIDKIYIENNSMYAQLRNDYKDVKKELNNNIDNIKIKIDEQSVEQKNFNQHLNRELFDLKCSNFDLKKKIDDISERIYKIHNKILDNKYTIHNTENKNVKKNNIDIKKDEK